MREVRGPRPGRGRDKSASSPTPWLSAACCLAGALGAAAAPALLLSGVAECSTDAGEPRLERGTGACTAAGVARCAATEVEVGVFFQNFNGANESIVLCAPPAGGGGGGGAGTEPLFALVGGLYLVGQGHGQHCAAWGDGSCARDACGAKTLFSVPPGPHGGFVDGVFSWCFGAAADAIPASGLAHCRSLGTPNQEGYPYANVTLGTLAGFCETRQYCVPGSVPATLFQRGPGPAGASDETVLCCTDPKRCPPYTPWAM